MTPAAPSPFLDIPEAEWVCASDLYLAIFDSFPVSPGHVFVITRRVVPTFFTCRPDEQAALMELVGTVKRTDTEAVRGSERRDMRQGSGGASCFRAPSPRTIGDRTTIPQPCPTSARIPHDGRHTARLAMPAEDADRDPRRRDGGPAADEMPSSARGSRGVRVNSGAFREARASCSSSLGGPPPAGVHPALRA